MDIEEMLSQFNTVADSSKEHLHKILDLIADGKVPDHLDVLQMDALIASLQIKYNDICVAAASDLSEDEMPEEGAAVTEYVHAVQNSATAAYRQQLKGIKGVLDLFVSVQAEAERYAKALQKFQDDARELLGSLEGQKQETTDLEQTVAGPKAFLAALGCEDMESDEAADLLEQVDTFYPAIVGRGLYSHQYVLPRTEEAKAPFDPEALIDAVAKETGVTWEEAAAVALEACRDSLCAEAAEIHSNSASATSDEDVADRENVASNIAHDGATIEDQQADTDNISENNNDTEAQSVFVQRLIANGVLLDDASVLGLMTAPGNSNENKKVTATIFRNDIAKGDAYGNRVALRLISTHNVVSSSQLIMKSMLPDFAADNVLRDLENKGYLRRYGLYSKGYFYCASPRLVKALTFKDGAKAAGVRQLSKETWGDSIEDKNTSAAARIAFDQLYCENYMSLEIAGHHVKSESSVIMTDAFILRLKTEDGEEFSSISVGAFWDNAEECDVFLDNLRAILEGQTHFHFVSVAAYDTKKAKALLDILMEDLNLQGDQVLLYIMEDLSFYTYPDCNKAEGFFKLEDANEEVTESDTSSETGDDASEEQRATIAKEDEREDASVENANSTEDDQKSVAVEDVPVSIQPARPVVSATSVQSKNVPVIDAKNDDTPDLLETVGSFINERRVYAASAYARAYAMQDSSSAGFSKRLAYAVDDPVERCYYSAANALSLIESEDGLEGALALSTAVRTFFSNQYRYDYNLKSYYAGIKEYRLLKDYPELGKVLHYLMEFKDQQQKGMDAYADYHSTKESDVADKLQSIQHEAKDFYNNYVLNKKTETAKHKRFVETKKYIFNPDSDLCQYINAIATGDNDMHHLAEDYLHEHFYEDDIEISEDNIDNNKLAAFVDDCWDQMGTLMASRKREPLMGHFRNNLINQTEKAVRLIATWCVYVNRVGDHLEDEGRIAYNKIHDRLLGHIDGAITALEKDVKRLADKEDEQAGLRIIVYTLRDIRACLDGTREEGVRRYYYVPFLMTDDVMLDENYLPDFGMHSSTLASLLPTTRIRHHVERMRTYKLSFEDRLLQIQEESDNYGAAGLIVRYLDRLAPEAKLKSDMEDAFAGEENAQKRAEKAHDDFIGSLELAQTYGQIDNSAEDKKEKILQIAEEWNTWAMETKNYGFLKQVMNTYLAEIREEAKGREADLMAQLADFRATSVPGLSVEDKGKRIDRILAMISDQNYTVAEDLLARATDPDDHEIIIEEDFLKDFLDHYDDYYDPVASHRQSFASLVSSRTRNKEQRGAKKLADNWLPGGARMGQERLAALLGYLGFAKAEVKPQSQIGKFEQYFVKTATAKGGHRDSYTHPIAAFGSGAASEGFRVVCINGTYNADELIDVMKQIGNAKHTLILLDHALTKSERRRLARKSKNALGDKMFGVIDRTVMMFLVRNYDDMRVNRMLMALITPFAYYQPYVWESANVMPPEIFMGRKTELERIESPTGVNIVYGGRQLGKSALLKKAREEIDHNENGDRAVLVDIKGHNYRDAARKIGYALHDEGILDQEIDTDNWDVLARAVKNRLRSSQNEIPYLLLLLDEADTFIDSCAEVNYQPFDALKDIQSVGAGRFKFVIAGLRNIVRFKREALGNNSVLTHLEPMTILPFKPAEARELLEIPLHYLGFRFTKENEVLISLILATCNYFPGLIQLYCAKLITALHSKDYANYNEAESPEYKVSDSHIKKVLADREFGGQIREKYFITLQLEEDNYYSLIALLLASLYHKNGYSSGYTAAEIKDAGSELDIRKIADLDDNKLEAFMEELCELNVLRHTVDSRYLFTRFTFFQMMGTSAEVEDALMDYMEE